MNILQAIESPEIFRPLFRDLRTWNSWLIFLKALFALPMERKDRKLFRACTNRARIPKQPFKEAYVIAGRRSGKSYISSIVAVFLAVFKDWREYLSPGERGFIFIIANDKSQASVIKNYVSAILHSQAMFSKMIERELTDEIYLSNGTAIIIKSSDFRTLRGYTVLAAILEEIAFWRSEEYANPAEEIIRSLKPSLATIPESLLLGISTPYSRSGYLFVRFKELYGTNSRTLIWRARTEIMNPSLDRNIIRDAMREDRSSALAEWGAEFRDDIESFLPLELIESAVIPNRFEVPPWLHQSLKYYAFCDPSGGRQDSMTLAISHQVKGKIILDNLMEVRPPFSPEDVVYQFSQLLKSYRIEVVKGDRYSGEWCTSAFRRHGMFYENSELSKSEIYLSFLPLMSNGNVELLDSKRLVSQLRSLERKTRSGGRDNIDHPPGCHDDIANAAAGACVKCWQESSIERLPEISFGIPESPALSSDQELERYSRKWLLDDKVKPKVKSRLGRVWYEDEDGNVVEENEDENDE